MRIIKGHDERRNEIIQTATHLFMEKGYDACSVNDILTAVGIAKGTFYYYFKSKEDVLDAGIEQLSERVFARVKEISEDKQASPVDRMLKIMMAIRIKDKFADTLIEEMHKKNNALLHQKTLVSILNRLTPVFTEIVEEGNKDGVFVCPYPEQCIQILLSSALTLLDDGIFHFAKEKERLILQALFFTTEKILGIGNHEISSRLADIYEVDKEDL